MAARRTIPNPNNLLLGNGELYFNGEFVGTLGGAVVFKQKKEYAEQRAGDSISASAAQVTKEEVTLEAEIAEFKLTNLKYALGIANAIEAGPFNITRVEFITLTGTTPVTLAETAVGAIRVFNTTRSLEYLLTTDFTFATNAVTRSGGGAITSGQVVLVQYTVAVTATNKIAGGGSCSIPVFQLDFVHKECDNEGVQISIFRAYSNTDFSVSFDTRESGKFTMHNVTFRGLLDSSRLPGKNLFEIIVES